MKIVGITPRKSQLEVLTLGVRFKVIAAGRRFGKTIAALNWILEGAVNHPGWNCMWVAPTYRQGRYAFKRLMTALRLGKGLGIVARVSESDMVVELINHSVISFRTAENYDNLRAEGINRLVIDEAARVPKAAWEEVLRPAISDTGGDVMFISTPKGRNWFYHLWLMGQKPEEFPDYKSWRFPSYDNPLITPQEIEQVRATMPENIFRQEFLAEFIDEAGEVIPNVDACVVLPALEKERKKEKQYYAGIDLARVQDFTVVCVLDSEYRLVDFLRLRQINWDIQKNEIEAMLKKYDALSDCDSTGVGDPIVESLIMSGASVKGFVFSATSKRALIQNLIFGFANQQIKLPPVPELISELKALTYKQGPSGQLSYEAPAGMHDDCVMALALAYWSATRERWPGIFAL